MKKKISIKSKATKLARVLGWAAFAISFIVLLGAAIDIQNEVKCKNIIVDIDYSEGLFFIDEREIHRQIATSPEGDSTIGTPIGQLNLKELEQRIADHPHVKKLSLYMNIDGELNIDVTQRQPVIRIINTNGVSYYIDKSGDIIPTSPNFTARVLVATNVSAIIPESRIADGSSQLNDLFTLARFIEQDKFWKAQVSQVVVNQAGEYEIIPRLGGHSILIGAVKNLEDKFERLAVFYKEGLPNTGWGTYQRINLKFKDQIVCTKR